MRSTLLSSSPGGSRGPAAAGTSLGGYEVERTLGEGSMGEVFLGRHRRLGRHVALKVLRPELLQEQRLIQRFLQEGRIVNQINHAHIVEVYDFVEETEPARIFCVMEYLEGETLGQRMASGTLSLQSVRRMGREMASALGAAHAVGVVHRDLKPENIFLVTRDGRDDWVKVLDFGIAKSVPWQGEVDLVESNLGILLGTPRYMAPEQMACLEVTGQSDVYALGTILYELVAGRPPFEAEAFGQLSADIITRAPPPLPRQTAAGEQVPRELNALIMACLAKDPADRPASMREVESTLAGEPARAPRSAWRPGVTGAALSAVVLLTLAMGLETTPAPVEPEVAYSLPSLLPVPPPAEVQLVIVSQPPGALVRRLDTGVPLGHTPLDVLIPRGETPVVVRLELPGFFPLEQGVETGQGAAYELALHALPVTRPQRRRPLRAVTDGVLDPY